MPASTKSPRTAGSVVNPMSSVPRLASRLAVPSVVNSILGPEDAIPFGYCTRPSDDLRVNLVLPPSLPPAANSVAVPRTVVLVTGLSQVVLTIVLPVTRAGVFSMRVPVSTVST